ncbi:hypothetical protein PENTCL1PPCAC_6386, partial [Pristionchus entomophagus]
LLFFLLSFFSLSITTVFSQQINDYDSGEIAFNNTSINKNDDQVRVYYFQPEKEWNQLKAILAISTVAGCLAFVGFCCVCGLRAAWSPQDESKRKYLSHA